MKLSLRQRRMAQILGLFAVFVLAIIFLAIQPTINLLQHRDESRSKSEEVAIVQRKLDDRKLLETYDETFQEELATTLGTLEPFVQGQGFVNELEQSSRTMGLNISDLREEVLDGQRRVRCTISGTYEAQIKWLFKMETHRIPVQLESWQGVSKGRELESSFAFLIKEIRS